MNKLSEETDGFSGSDIEQACIDALKRTILDEKDFISFDEVKKAIIRQRNKMRAKRASKHE